MEKDLSGARRSPWAALFKILCVVVWVLSPLYAVHLLIFIGFGQIPSASLKAVMIGAGIGLGLLFFMLPPLHWPLVRILEKKMPRGQGLLYFAKALISLAIVLLLVSYWHSNQRRDRLDWIFREFLADPMPQNVKIIDGSFVKWMDWSGNLIFETDKGTFDNLSADYTPFPAEMVAGSYFERDIRFIPGVACFNKKVKLNDRMYDDCYLYWDQNAQRAYFHVNNAFYRKRDMDR